MERVNQLNQKLFFAIAGDGKIVNSIPIKRMKPCFFGGFNKREAFQLPLIPVGY